MKIILKIGLFLSLFNPFLVATSNVQQQELIEILDQIIKAKRYWADLACTPVGRSLTRPFFEWINHSWHEEIPYKLTCLEVFQKNIAEKLGQSLNGKIFEKDELKDLKVTTHKHLLVHGIPSHFRRHWLGYTCGAIATGLLAYKLKQMLEKNCIFTFTCDDTVYNRIVSNLKTGKNPFNFHATCDGDKRFIRTEKTYEPLVSTAIFKGSNGHLFTIRTTTIKDIPLEFYNQEGVHALMEFLQKSVVTPLNNLHKELFEKTNTKNFGDPYKALQAYKEDLKILEANAFKSDNYPLLFSIQENKYGKIMIDRSLEELEKLRDDIITLEENRGILASGFYHLGRTIAGRDSALGRAYTSKKKEIEIKFAHGFAAVNKIDEKMTLLIEFIAMMPPAVLAWIGYNGTKNLNRQHYNQTVLEPLKEDLHDFQILLDEYRYLKEPDLYFKGMQGYWVNKLNTYKNYIAKEHRMNFSRDIGRLISNISVDHQLSIVTSLLHYGVPNF